MTIEVEAALFAPEDVDIQGYHAAHFFEGQEWPEHDDERTAMKWLNERYLGADPNGVSVRVRLSQNGRPVTKWLPLEGPSGK